MNHFVIYINMYEVQNICIMGASCGVFYLGTEFCFLKSWRQNCIRRQIGRRQICVRGKLVPTGRTRTIGPILYRRSTSTSRNAVLRARANTVSAVRHTGTREFRRRPLQLITYYIKEGWAYATWARLGIRIADRGSLIARLADL
jgi:hypothetical protein